MNDKNYFTGRKSYYTVCISSRCMYSIAISLCGDIATDIP
nr:MAG TPA: hypothetical protein [Caudoviricetes sp.]